jgi:hypothetical protein
VLEQHEPALAVAEPVGIVDELHEIQLRPELLDLLLEVDQPIAQLIALDQPFPNAVLVLLDHRFELVVPAIDPFHEGVDAWIDWCLF